MPNNLNTEAPIIIAMYRIESYLHRQLSLTCHQILYKQHGENASIY
jgi:hypothetical protein